ncbi:FAD-dependent oxidoreductase [Maritimibacter alkaliphilus]|uniref:FAD-dependent oxidoreductase n=1 Tax=Maritimibacter alkaliphilus TaxID=404236 RepID=UPI001C948FF4|nr:FAD-dependent monooxygenase [Maritimibacter alkaliphilus]MBY6092859.1 FAD-dependent monooxygenase [Maritimibacter alkaliphilus]
MVLIAGGGPVGMSTALALALKGIPVTVLEAAATFADDPRASSIHPATLDLLEPLGLEEEIMALGHRVSTWQFWDRVEGPVVKLHLDELEGLTNHPFRIQLEQHVLCGLILKRLQALGAEVRFETRVTGVSQDDNRVQVEVETPTGSETLTGAYLVAADGGRSTIRKALDIPFEGYSLSELFVVVTTLHDFSRYGYEDACHFADPDEWATLFRVPNGKDRPFWRISMPVLPGIPREEAARFDVCADRLRILLDEGDSVEILHSNLYGVHQRVAARFREGRILLAGDAAHVNGPTGALGMNFGIQDAIFLADQLARVYETGADAALDRYDRQRRTLAEAILQTQPQRIKQRLETREPEERRRRNEALRQMGADPARRLEFLKEQCMLNSVQEALAIA